MEEIHRYITAAFEERDVPLLGIYTCHHGPDDGCDCRKPKTGLFEQAAIEHSINLNESYIIGDSLGDVAVGKSLGMGTILVRTGNGRSAEKGLVQKGVEVDYVGDTLRDCARFIAGRETLS